MTTAEDVIGQAEKWVGFVEGPRNDNPFGRWYGMPNVAYCAQAVSHWTFHAGLPTPASTAKGYAYTPSGANWFKAQGRWGTTPRKGAHVFFRFSGPRIHHVGLVTSDDGVFPIQTIEANTSRGAAGSQRDGGGVWRRARAAGIVGYGYPNYESEDWMTSDEAERLLSGIDDVVRNAYNSATQARDEVRELRAEVAALRVSVDDAGEDLPGEVDRLRRGVRALLERSGGNVENGP